MGMGAFKLGQRVSYGSASLKIVRQLPEGFWVLEDLSTGRYSEHATLDLLRAWERGDLAFPRQDCAYGYDAPIGDLLNAYGDAFRLTYPEKAWEKARMKLEFVFRLRKLPITESVLTPRVQQIWEDADVWKTLPRPKVAPSFSSVAGWIRIYRQADRDIRALIDRTAERGRRGPRYPDEVTELVDDVIETSYMSRERPTQADVLGDIRGRIEQINRTRPPSEQLVKPGKCFLARRIAAIPAFDVYAARYGMPAARIKFRAPGEGVQTGRPLERVALDHHRMDLFVVDEETGFPLGRPWLTLLLDEHTRYVVGYYIGFEEPSNVSVARAIRHAIAPKTVEEGLDVKQEWDAWGVIEQLIVDNGLELHGETIERGCAFFGTKIQYCPRKKPWYKGKIERFFRTMGQGLYLSIPGKTFEDIFERGDYDPAKHAVVSLTTLRKIVQKWIIDIYHQKRHSSLGKSPAQAWGESIRTIDRYLPESSILLDAAFSKSEKRRLTKDGIEFDSLLYQSDDLRRIREDMGSEIDVDVRVMDDDLGWLMVLVPDSKTALRVNAVKGDYATGLTRWQHKICKRYKARLYQRDGVDLELYEAKQYIRNLIVHDTNLVKRGSRARQKRFVGDDASLVSGDKVASHDANQPDLMPAEACLTQPAPSGPFTTLESRPIPSYTPIIRSQATSPQETNS